MAWKSASRDLVWREDPWRGQISVAAFPPPLRQRAPLPASWGGGSEGEGEEECGAPSCGGSGWVLLGDRTPRYGPQSRHGLQWVGHSSRGTEHRGGFAPSAPDPGRKAGRHFQLGRAPGDLPESFHTPLFPPAEGAREPCPHASEVHRACPGRYKSPKVRHPEGIPSLSSSPKQSKASPTPHHRLPDPTK